MSNEICECKHPVHFGSCGGDLVEGFPTCDCTVTARPDDHGECCEHLESDHYEHRFEDWNDGCSKCADRHGFIPYSARPDLQTDVLRADEGDKGEAVMNASVCSKCGRLEEPHICKSFTARPDEGNKDEFRDVSNKLWYRIQILRQSVEKIDVREFEADFQQAVNLYTSLESQLAAERTRRSLETELQRIYGLEQNVEISSFWDGGWTLRFGDSSNGYTQTERHHNLRTLIESLAKYPAEDDTDA
jgi:hypothetical protein